jgi:hypothetical protein
METIGDEEVSSKLRNTEVIEILFSVALKLHDPPCPHPTPYHTPTRALITAVILASSPN